MTDEIRSAVERLSAIDRAHSEEAVEAARALAALGAEMLCAALRTPEALNVPAGRHEVSAQLARHRAADVADALLDALNHPDWRPVQVATDAIGLMRDAMTPVLIAGLTPDGPTRGLLNTITALRRMGVNAAGGALAVLAREHADEQVRAASVEALGWMGVDEAPATIVSALSDDSAAVRLKAAKAAGWMRVREAVEGVLAFARGADPAGRAAAVYALDRIGDTRATLFVVECLEDPDPCVRWSAAVALRRLWTPDCTPALRKAAADLEETVAAAARETSSMVLK